MAAAANPAPSRPRCARSCRTSWNRMAGEYGRCASPANAPTKAGCQGDQLCGVRREQATAPIFTAARRRAAGHGHSLPHEHAPRGVERRRDHFHLAPPCSSRIAHARDEHDGTSAGGERQGHRATQRRIDNHGARCHTLRSQSRVDRQRPAVRHGCAQRRQNGQSSNPGVLRAGECRRRRKADERECTQRTMHRSCVIEGQ